MNARDGLRFSGLNLGQEDAGPLDDLKSCLSDNAHVYADGGER